MDPPRRERSDLLTSIQSRDRSSACPGRSPVEAAFYTTLARGGAKIIECSGIVSFLETASSTAERVDYCSQKIAENSVIFAISETICTVVHSTEQQTGVSPRSRMPVPRTTAVDLHYHSGEFRKLSTRNDILRSAIDIHYTTFLCPSQIRRPTPESIRCAETQPS